MVTKSPLTSETLALNEGAYAANLLATQIRNIFTESPFTNDIIKLKSLFETLKTTNATKDLRLRVDVARLR